VALVETDPSRYGVPEVVTRDVPDWQRAENSLYRGDTRPPEEIRADGGFRPPYETRPGWRDDPSMRDPNLPQHVHGDANAFVSTSTDTVVARERAGTGEGRMYVINAPGGIDTDATMRPTNDRETQYGEAEYLFPGGIDWRYVRGWHQVRYESGTGLVLGDFTPNPDYIGDRPDPSPGPVPRTDTSSADPGPPGTSPDTPPPGTSPSDTSTTGTSGTSGTSGTDTRSDADRQDPQRDQRQDQQQPAGQSGQQPGQRPTDSGLPVRQPGQYGPPAHDTRPPADQSRQGRDSSPLTEQQRHDRSLPLGDRMGRLDDPRLDALRQYMRSTDGGMSAFAPGGTDQRQRWDHQNEQYTANQVPRIPGQFVVDLHGSADSVRVGDTPLSPRDLADLIRANPDYDGGPVSLLGCDTGSDPNGFAAQLARELGVPVTAPSRDAWVDHNGNVFASSQAYNHDSSRPATPTWPPNGNWNTYGPTG
jgi:hypothetical protein